ncbi:hypothetical protein M8C21_032917, partial [Ambrosia artemisiifolia]
REKGKLSEREREPVVVVHGFSKPREHHGIYIQRFRQSTSSSKLLFADWSGVIQAGLQPSIVAIIVGKAITYFFGRKVVELATCPNAAVRPFK